MGEKTTAAAQIVSSILQRKDTMVCVAVRTRTNEIILGVRDYKEVTGLKTEITLKDLIQSVKESL